MPQQAKSIVGAEAQKMLLSLLQTEVQTTLRETPIRTVYMKEGALDSKETGDHPAVLLLHGFDSNLLEYRYLLPLLSPKCEVHAVDLLGWGLTEKPIDIRYDPKSRRAHLHAYWLQNVGRAVTLIGASLGGAIAVDFALAYPEAVESVVLVDGQIFQDRGPNPLLSKIPALAELGAETLRADWLRRLAISMSYHDDSFKNEDTLRIGALHCYTDGWKNAAVDFIQGDGYCVSSSVQDLQQRTLALWGEHDAILPKGDLQRCLDRIHNCELNVIKGAGHSPHIEKAHDVARCILEFIFETGEEVI